MNAKCICKQEEQTDFGFDFQQLAVEAVLGSVVFPYHVRVLSTLQKLCLHAPNQCVLKPLTESSPTVTLITVAVS